MNPDPTTSSSRITYGRVHSSRKRIANVNKAIRLANACTDRHEKHVHTLRAEKLAKRYGMKLNLKK